MELRADILPADLKDGPTRGIEHGKRYPHHVEMCVQQPLEPGEIDQIGNVIIHHCSVIFPAM